MTVIVLKCQILAVPWCDSPYGCNSRLAYTSEKRVCFGNKISYTDSAYYKLSLDEWFLVIAATLHRERNSKIRLELFQPNHQTFNNSK